MGCGATKSKKADSKSKKDSPAKKPVQPSHERRHYNLSDFPTPDLLVYAQRKYHEDKRHPKRSDSIPPPFPPPTTKAQIFRASDYRHIDEYAQAAPLKLAANGYDALVSYLIRPATNDVGKVRAFFVWIAAQRLQKIIDFIGSEVPPADKPLFMMLLILGKQWGNGYSELFANMCRQAKIPCKIVKGRVKGSGYRLGEKTKGTNDYCVVYVDGAWRFVDQHWGSQYTIAGVESDDWELIRQNADDDPNDRPSKENEAKLHCEGWDYICDDFYFLTDPEAIVYTHLTCDPALQLLARPVTEEEFWQMAFLKDAFFELEMTTVNHPKCLLEADSDGKTAFEFGLSGHRSCAFSFALSKSTQDPTLNLVNGVTLDQFVMMERSNGKLSILINFPKLGRYKFDLFGRDENTKVGFTTVCEYVIMCKKPNFDFEPYPENTRSEWGAGNDTERLGLQPVDVVEGGILIANDGKAMAKFTTNGSKNLLFQTKLKSPDNAGEQLDDCVRHFRTSDDVTFLMKLPRRGRFVFMIYAMDPHKDKAFHNVCNYIVRSDQGCYDLAPYPPSDNKYGRTGDQSVKSTDLRLAAQSPKEAVIDPLNKGELNVVLTAEADTELHAEMKRYFQLEREIDCSQYVLCHQTRKEVHVQMNFPKVGFYKLNVLSQKKIVYQYLINVQKPNAKCPPFPTSTPNWKSQYEIIEPKNGLLGTNQKIHFKVRVPDVKIVSVEMGGISKDLNCKKKTPDVWEGDFVTPRESGKLQILSSKEIAKERQQLLMVYKVMSADEMDDLRREQETANKRADQLQKEIEEQKSAEKKEADLIKKVEIERLTRKEEDFKKNRERYEREEAMRQKTEDEAAKRNTYNSDDASTEDGKMDSSDLIELIQSKKHAQQSQENRTERKEHFPVLTSQDYAGHDSGRRDQKRGQMTQTHRNIGFYNPSSRLYRVEGSEGWKKYHPRLVNSLALEKLRESIRTRDRTMLNMAIEDCNSNGLQNNAEVKDAARTLQVIEARRALQKACEEKDAGAIRNQIEQIRSSGLLRNLQDEVREAHYHLEFMERMPHGRQSILDMDKKTMSEIRRYQNPPPVLHKVLQGAFLLLGEDEDTTDSWKECQRICNPQGANGLTRKVLDFNINRVEPEIVARAKEILTKDVDITKVQTVGPGTGTFYVWAMGVIDEYDSTLGGDTREVRPANRERQRELFGRHPPPEPTKNRNYYKNLAVNGSNQYGTNSRSPRENRHGDMSWR